MLEKIKKRICLVLVCVMLFVSVPGIAFATGTDEPVAFNTEPILEAPEIEEYLLNDESRFDADVFTEDFLDED